EDLIKSCKEIEGLFGHSFLDIEFAFNKKGTLFILQVRPIVTVYKEDLSSIDLVGELGKVSKFIKKNSSKRNGLLGDSVIYGVMPDWNPAEIIGLKPKPLSLSLYKELITDKVWSQQRYNYGYRDLRSFPLMTSLTGMPYIDCRVDFNSFVPRDISKKTAEKLVNYYLNKLKENPSFHDKVEFEIIQSCFHFNINKRLDELSNNGFTKKEINSIRNSLLKTTNHIINPQNGLYVKDTEAVKILEAKHKEVLDSNISEHKKIEQLIKYCKKYGTLPFAGIARSAFIATQLLRSLVEVKIISQDDYNSYMNSLSTVAKHMNNDLYDYSKNKISKRNLFNKYGHLRPGTYDILSPRYD
ncbi:MAG: hypothetical protein R3321_14560, partial [Nitrososphaeraceae archaeon]|nr:hypothetical protein [Nitrososphaeraceae archaeon]